MDTDLAQQQHELAEQNEKIQLHQDTLDANRDIHMQQWAQNEHDNDVRTAERALIEMKKERGRALVTKWKKKQKLLAEQKQKEAVVPWTVVQPPPLSQSARQAHQPRHDSTKYAALSEPVKNEPVPPQRTKRVALTSKPNRQDRDSHSHRLRHEYTNDPHSYRDSNHHRHEHDSDSESHQSPRERVDSERHVHLGKQNSMDMDKDKEMVAVRQLAVAHRQFELTASDSDTAVDSRYCFHLDSTIVRQAATAPTKTPALTLNRVSDNATTGQHASLKTSNASEPNGHSGLTPQKQSDTGQNPLPKGNSSQGSTLWSRRQKL